MPAQATAKKDVAALEHEIRSRVNHPRLRSSMSSDALKFNVLHCALDAVGDAEVALDAYLHMPEPGSVGERYIGVYGVLQVMFVEQQAVRAICEAFSLQFDRTDLLRRVADIRNASVGHPVPNKPGKPTRFVSRADLRHGSFGLLLSYTDKPFESLTIDLFDLIASQRRDLGNLLEAVLTGMDQDELSHRQRFRATKIAPLLHDSIPWLLSKVGSTARAEDTSIAKGNLRSIQAMIENVRSELDQRSEGGPFDGLFDEIHHSIQRIQDILAATDGSDSAARDLAIYAEHLEDRLADLKRASEEIDRIYASDDPSK